MTADQIQANRQSAARLAKQALGLFDIQLSDWTPAQRAAYDHKLASIILQYPDRFDASDVTRAQQVQNKDYSQVDASFSFSDFAAETWAPAGAALQSIGNGVLSVANAAKWAIPVLAIGAVILLAYWANNKAGKPIRLPGAS